MGSNKVTRAVLVLEVVLIVCIWPVSGWGHHHSATITPTNVYLFAGQNLELTCTLDAANEIDVQNVTFCTANGKSLDQYVSRDESERAVTLTIPNITANGIYVCQPGPCGLSTVPWYTLKFVDVTADVRIYPRHPVYLVSGSTLQLNCTLNAKLYPAARIEEMTFTRHNVSLKGFLTYYPDEGILSLVQPNVTTLLQPGSNKSGNFFFYFCGNKTESTSSRSHDLKAVNVAERAIEIWPKYVFLVSGSELELNCTVNLTQLNRKYSINVDITDLTLIHRGVDLKDHVTYYMREVPHVDVMGSKTTYTEEGIISLVRGNITSQEMYTCRCRCLCRCKCTGGNSDKKNNCSKVNEVRSRTVHVTEGKFLNVISVSPGNPFVLEMHGTVQVHFASSDKIILNVRLRLIFKGRMNITVKITPEFPLFLVTGSLLKLNCTVSQMEGKEVGIDIHSFTILENYRRQKFNIEQYLTRYSEEGIISLVKPNITRSGTYLCTCKENVDGYLDCLNKSGYGHDLRKVLVSDRPELPTNITCISYNWKQLTCYGYLTKNPDPNIHVTYVMQYRTNESWNCSLSSRGFSIMCNGTFIPCLNYRASSCAKNIMYHYTITYTSGIYNFSPTEKINITVYRNDSSIVKPGPMESVTVNHTSNSHQARLHWNCPQDLAPFCITYPKFTCRVNFRDTDGHGQDKNDIFQAKCIENSDAGYFEYKMSGLTPFTNYSVTVSCKPAKANDIYWSNHSDSVAFTTHADRPAGVTSFTVGSYLWNGDYLYIYWKNDFSWKWNGRNHGYKLSLETSDGNMECPDFRIEGEQNDGGGNVSICPVTNYTAVVRLTNSVGVSSVSSHIHILSKDNAKPYRPEYVLVEESDSEGRNITYKITWKAEKDRCEQITHVTYYWCLAKFVKSSYFHCEPDVPNHNLTWETHNVLDACNDTETVFIKTLPDIAHSRWRFAVSVQAGNVSGGMVWQNCTYHLNKPPKQTAFTVTASAVEGNTAVTFAPHCELMSSGPPTSGRPLWYGAAYVTDERTSCSQDTTKIPAQVGQQKIPLLKFDPSSKGSYVCAMVLNKQGNFSVNQFVPNTEFAVSDTQAEDTKIIELAVGVPVPIIAVILVAVIIGFRKKIYRFFKPHIDVAILPVDSGGVTGGPDEQINGKTQRGGDSTSQTSSEDSGTSTMPSEETQEPGNGPLPACYVRNSNRLPTDEFYTSHSRVAQDVGDQAGNLSGGEIIVNIPDVVDTSDGNYQVTTVLHSSESDPKPSGDYVKNDTDIQLRLKENPASCERHSEEIVTMPDVGNDYLKCTESEHFIPKGNGAAVERHPSSCTPRNDVLEDALQPLLQSDGPELGPYSPVLLLNKEEIAHYLESSDGRLGEQSNVAVGETIPGNSGNLNFLSGKSSVPHTMSGQSCDDYVQAGQNRLTNARDRPDSERPFSKSVAEEHEKQRQLEQFQLICQIDGQDVNRTVPEFRENVASGRELSDRQGNSDGSNGISPYQQVVYPIDETVGNSQTLLPRPGVSSREINSHPAALDLKETPYVQLQDQMLQGEGHFVQPGNQVALLAGSRNFTASNLIPSDSNRQEPSLLVLQANCEQRESNSRGSIKSTLNSGETKGIDSYLRTEYKNKPFVIRMEDGPNVCASTSVSTLDSTEKTGPLPPQNVTKSPHSPYISENQMKNLTMPCEKATTNIYIESSDLENTNIAQAHHVPPKAANTKENINGRLHLPQSIVQRNMCNPLPQGGGYADGRSGSSIDHQKPFKSKECHVHSPTVTADSRINPSNLGVFNCDKNGSNTESANSGNKVADSLEDMSGKTGTCMGKDGTSDPGYVPNCTGNSQAQHQHQASENSIRNSTVVKTSEGVEKVSSASSDLPINTTQIASSGSPYVKSMSQADLNQAVPCNVKPCASENGFNGSKQIPEHQVEDDHFSKLCEKELESQTESFPTCSSSSNPFDDSTNNTSISGSLDSLSDMNWTKCPSGPNSGYIDVEFGQNLCEGITENYCRNTGFNNPEELLHSQNGNFSHEKSPPDRTSPSFNKSLSSLQHGCGIMSGRSQNNANMVPLSDNAGNIPEAEQDYVKSTRL